MPSSVKDQPKYLRCTRALALVTGLAGGVTIAGSTASAAIYAGGPGGVSGNPDAADADTPVEAYDGGVHGVVANQPSGCGCDLGGAPCAPSGPLGAGLLAAGLLARRRRRPDAP